MRLALAALAAAGLLFAPQASARPFDKLDAGLKQLATAKRAKPAPGGALVQPVRPEVRGGKVLVDVYVRGGVRDGADALRDEGMRVDATSARSAQRIVEGWVPITV